MKYLLIKTVDVCCVVLSLIHWLLIMIILVAPALNLVVNVSVDYYVKNVMLVLDNLMMILYYFLPPPNICNHKVWDNLL